MLSSDAPAEEESGFNASGTGGGGYLDDLAGLDFPVESQTTDSTGSSRLHADISSTTDVSESLSERFETLELPQDVDISKLDDDGKATELRVMFPELKEVDITFALKKAGGDFMKACEDLLNTQYLEENGLLSRGIDGAFRLDGEIVYRKGKQSFVHQRLVPALSDPFPATTSSQSLPFLCSSCFPKLVHLISNLPKGTLRQTWLQINLAEQNSTSTIAWLLPQWMQTTPTPPTLATRRGPSHQLSQLAQPPHEQPFRIPHQVLPLRLQAVLPRPQALERRNPPSGKRWAPSAEPTTSSRASHPQPATTATTRGTPSPAQPAAASRTTTS